MSAKLEVQWSPIPNKFITWASEICFYEVQPLSELNHMKLSNSTEAKLLSTNTNYNSIKCLDIYPKSENDLLLAIGQSNGRVTLSSFGTAEFNIPSLPGKEFVPRQGRPCNAVLWNPVETNLLAVALDKHRSDNSVLLWDIMKYPINMNETVNSGRFPVNTMAPALGLAKPVVELGIGETAHSLSWVNSNSKLMAVGMNQKSIKLVDFRDPDKIINSTITKAVYGVSVNPHDEKLITSFVDNCIYVWDTRNFEKPILTLNQTKAVLKVEWCPTRCNLLSSLTKDSSVINLYNIQQTMVGNEEVEPTVLERVVIPGSPHNITSFSWHRTEENRILSIALSGTITDYTVFDRIALSWAPSSNIMWTYGRKVIKQVNDEKLGDISTKIKARVHKEYGLKKDLVENAELSDDEAVAKVWKWLALSNKLLGDAASRGPPKHPGVLSVLRLDPSANKTEPAALNWAELGNPNCQGTVKVYKNEERSKVLQLCNWHFDRDSNSLSKFLEQLEKRRAYSRAAMLAVFNLKIRSAIEILSKAADSEEGNSNLGIVAMALAGFSDDKNSIWKQFCSSPKAKLNDPHLKALFAFLTADNFNYEMVLNEKGVSVDDRVAFATTFLPDNKLFEFLKKLSDNLIEEGNLNGLLLTGNNADAIRLLQRYLDNTGDIQTTTLIGVRAFPDEPFATSAVREWMACYRNLLDRWQLWHERAHFDIMVNKRWPSEKPPQQVYISCNFCGKSISAYMHGLSRGRGSFPRMAGTANKLKMSACPNCRKPLPRCSICLMHMGTTTESSGENTGKIIEFKNWFTWCQTCRHGGHAGHMSKWFEEHSECPVTACNCRCYSIDAVTNPPFS